MAVGSTANAIKCPNCGLLNPGNATWCDCGYDFTTGEVGQDPSYSDGTSSGNSGYSVQRGGGSFLSFRAMVTPHVIRVLYYFGALVITVAGIFSMFSNPFIGVAVIAVGNLLWRMFCEAIILFFSMHDILASIERELRR